MVYENQGYKRLLEEVEQDLYQGWRALPLDYRANFIQVVS